MTITCGCRHKFESKDVPCPDGIEGCLVSHTGPMSYVCPKCGHDSYPDVAKALAEGGVVTEIALGAFNPLGMKRLEIVRD